MLKNKIKLIAIGLVTGTSLLFLWTFLMAYLSSSKTATIAINTIGEANWEMFILFPITLIAIIYLINNFINEEVNQKIRDDNAKRKTNKRAYSKIKVAK